MFTLPNLISLSRLPLALLLFKEDFVSRLIVLLLAMISDGLDGFLARRFQLSSKIGTLLDPLMDRFFMFIALTIFFSEGKIELLQGLTLLCRDAAVILFGFYLVFTNRLSKYKFRAIWCGKATTFLQFVVFLGIVWDIAIPQVFYALFVLLGISALVELYLNKEEQKSEKRPMSF